MSVDFVIITALEEERDAVLSKLPNYKKLPPTEDDIRVYFNCELSFEYPDGTSGLYSIILLCLLDYGRVQALNATKDAINRWKPRYVLLVGIAGGIEENGVALGDIVVSDLAVDYELQNDSFYNTPSVLLCRQVIQSFKNIGSEDIYDGRNSADARRLLPRSLWTVAARKLDQIDAAVALDDLRVPPGNRLEALKVDRIGQHSIRINDQYRICFSWAESGAEEVEVVDYH